MSKPPDYPDDVSQCSNTSMDRLINYEGSGPDMSKEMARMSDEFQKELREARSKQRKAEEELRFFKQRIAKEVSLSLKAEDTENMTNPVNKTRIREMYQRLRVNEWPKLTDQLRDERQDPERVQKMIQNVFQKAVEKVDAMKKSFSIILTEKIPENELPKKVQEHLQASIENMQLAIYHNKQAVMPAAVDAPVNCQELVTECYWLGCLMALNTPPLTLDWAKQQQGMDRWDILPRDITQSSDSVQKPPTQLDVAFERVEMHFVAQVQRLHRLVASETEEQSTQNPESEEDRSCREALLNTTLDFLRRTDQEQLAERLSSTALTDVKCRSKLKMHLHKRFVQVFEGVAEEESPAPLSQIYTELYIIEGGPSEVNQEHEVRHIKATSWKPADTPIPFENIFTQTYEQPIRTMLTVGVAGVGKTVLTQKFCLDWAERKSNQDVQLLFPFTFRELNVLRDKEFSLVGLVHYFFLQTKGLCSLEDLKLLFIFDGLDECRLPLDFSRTRVLTEPTESASVEELLVNLIRGSLLPSARLWITTRPAAANQIPAECISMVTEVRGFSDPQKEQYFRKRFRDEEQATRVISHIKRIRSLHIMSYIPIFAWILSKVLEHLLKSKITDLLPTTLTQMYIHFLVVQAKVKNIKYHEGSGADLHWTEETKEMVRSLGKLAFEQLQKGNLIFYESDLSESGLDAAEIARYSGVFTQVFREEPGLYQDKVYCFIHLTVQEFLAALHVHQTFFSCRKNLLSTQYRSTWFNAAFYHSAVDQALESPNGHMDLFLRFLLGLSLSDNQGLLTGLLTNTGSVKTNDETVKYIKEKLNEKGLSAERSLNLLHCLNELKDHSLEEEIQKIMRGGGVYDKRMSPAQWSALCFLLLSSDSPQGEFDLRKYCPSEEAFQSLMPVVKASNKAILSCCNLSERSCGPLASVLSSSSLTHLDLSNNDLWDSGVERLCEGLKSAPCRLGTLRLSGCLVSESGASSLASALSSASSHLKELDLSYNHPGVSAGLLTALRAPQGALVSLRLEPAGEKWLTPGLKKYFCELSLDPNTANGRLKLSDNNRTVTFVEEEQTYPDHQHRFHSCPQVLCSTALNGRYYWEVLLDMDLGQNEGVSIALSYIGITSKEDGKNSEFGANKESWALKISRESFSVSHDGTEFTLSYTPHFSRTAHSSHYDSCYQTRVAVYLNYTGEFLSFYEITEGRKTLLYTYHASFTQPLFAGFTVHRGSVSLVENDQ